MNSCRNICRRKRFLERFPAGSDATKPPFVAGFFIIKKRQIIDAFLDACAVILLITKHKTDKPGRKSCFPDNFFHRISPPLANSTSCAVSHLLLSWRDKVEC